MISYLKFLNNQEVKKRFVILNNWNNPWFNFIQGSMERTNVTAKENKLKPQKEKKNRT
jgi:hypothetical protein